MAKSSRNSILTILLENKGVNPCMIGLVIRCHKNQRINSVDLLILAQWSERSPFTSEAAGSILRENFLNVTRTQCSTHVKRVSQHSAESRGFSLGTPVSSHKEVDRVG